MTRVRQTGKEVPVKDLLSKKTILWPGLALLIGYFLWFNHPFPLDDGSLSRQEAARAALEYLGIDDEAADTFVTYDVNGPLTAYLQKEDLTSDYYDQYDAAYPLEYYRVEIGREDGERYEALVHVYEGTVAGWRLDMREGEAGQPEVDAAMARQIADAYLLEQRPGDLKEAGISVLEQDGGYLIRYEQSDDRIGEATRITTVTVSGDRVVAFSSAFQPPEDFLSWLEQQDTRSEQLTNLARWALELLAFAALVVAVVYRKLIRAADGLVFLAIVAAIDTMHHMNLLPNYISMLDVRSGSSSFLVLETVIALAFNTAFALLYYLPYIAGKAMLTRDGQRHLLPGPDSAGWSAEMRLAVRYGYLFACFILALQTLIFNVGDVLFHIWWIPDPFLSTDNMLWPLLMPLTAWSAALSEEIVYRLFAVTLLAKLLRSRWVAIVLSSMLWGLGHTAYPIYPVYTRFVEVTLIGIVFGWIFIRFGFAAAVITHAVLDSILMGFDIMSIGAAGAALSVLYMALPAAVGWLLARWQRGRPTHPAIT